MLLEFWLSAYHTRENLESIVKKYNDNGWKEQIKASIHYFIEYSTSTMYMDNSHADMTIWIGKTPFFDGMDKLFFDTLVPIRLKRSDRKGTNENKFKRFCSREFEVILSHLVNYLWVEKEYLIEHNLIIHRVPYWSDTLKAGYFLKKGSWGYFVRQVDLICDTPHDFHPLQVNLAMEIQKVFKDSELSVAAITDIKKARAGEWND